MLERIKSSDKYQIRFVFPSGEHQGELYTASLSFCQNPVCACGTLDLDVVRDMSADSGATSPEFRISVDIHTEEPQDSDRYVSEYEQNFCKAFVSHLREPDWDLLHEVFIQDKRRRTDEIPDEDLNTYFPASEIDRDGAMVSFSDILPYAEYRSIVLNGNLYELNEEYCVKYKCGCSEIVVVLMEENETESLNELMGFPMVFFDYETGKMRTEVSGGKSDAFFEQLAEELKSGDYPAWFRKRHDRLKSLYRIYKQRNAQQKLTVSTQKVGRNDPCPCGSGKKYKKCCLG